MKTVLLTTGTSLLTNRDRPWSPWERGSDLPRSADVERWLASADRRTASAETATLDAVGALDPHAPVVIHVIHSDTPDGRYCAERLAVWLRNTLKRPASARLHAIGHLGLKGGERFTAGLTRLAQKLGSLITEAKDAGCHDICIAATGGFKAEAAVAGVVGALLGVPVKYLHEQHREIATIPALPVTLDPAFIDAGGRRQVFAQFLSDPAARVPARSLHARLQADPAMDSCFERFAADDAEPVLGLSFLGSLIVGMIAQESAPGAEFPDAGTPPEEKNGLSAVRHHRPGGWEQMCRRLCAIPWICRIQYDDSAKGRSVPAPAPGSHTDILYGFGAKPDTLGLRIITTARSTEERDRMIMALQKSLA